MTQFKVGNRVRIKERPDWPTPPGFRLAGAEGKIVRWTYYSEIMDDFETYRHVRIEKAFGEAKVYEGNTFCLRSEDLVGI